MLPCRGGSGVDLGRVATGVGVVAITSSLQAPEVPANPSRRNRGWP